MVQTSLLLDVTSDVCARRHKNNPRSGAAMQRVSVRSWQLKVIEFVKQCGVHGATLDEACEFYRAMPNQLSGRFCELVRDGVIVKTARTRNTRTGSEATVYVVAGSVEVQGGR